MRARLSRLEARAQEVKPRGLPIMVDLVVAGGRMPAEERARRIAEAKRKKGPHDLLVVIDCPTCGGEPGER